MRLAYFTSTLHAGTVTDLGIPSASKGKDLWYLSVLCHHVVTSTLRRCPARFELIVSFDKCLGPTHIRKKS